MAQRMDVQLEPKPARRSRYPWDEWLDGSTWLLKAGEDFTVKAETMRVMIYQNARKRGVKATTELVGAVDAEDIIVRAYTPEPEPSA